MSDSLETAVYYVPRHSKFGRVEKGSALGLAGGAENDGDRLWPMLTSCQLVKGMVLDRGGGGIGRFGCGLSFGSIQGRGKSLG